QHIQVQIQLWSPQHIARLHDTAAAVSAAVQDFFRIGGDPKCDLAAAHVSITRPICSRVADGMAMMISSAWYFATMAPRLNTGPVTGTPWRRLPCFPTSSSTTTTGSISSLGLPSMFLITPEPDSPAPMIAARRELE